jgi:hypothetical protein
MQKEACAQNLNMNLEVFFFCNLNTIFFFTLGLFYLPPPQAEKRTTTTAKKARWIQQQYSHFGTTPFATQGQTPAVFCPRIQTLDYNQRKMGNLILAHTSIRKEPFLLVSATTNKVYHQRTKVFIASKLHL